MSIIYIFRDSWADIVLALNISLGFVALIITLFIIIRVRNKIYNNKKKKVVQELSTMSYKNSKRC